MKAWLQQLQQKTPEIVCAQGALSWSQLCNLVEVRKKFLQDRGMQSGDIVAACGSKLWLLQTWLACLELDLIFCPVSPKYQSTTAPTQRSVSSCEGERKVIWHDENSPALLSNGLFSEWSFLKNIPSACLLLYTSASTGPGKWVAYESSCVENQIISHSIALNLRSGASRLQILPLFHTFGLVLDLCVGLYMGQKIHLIESSSLVSTAWLKLAHTQSWDMALTPRLAHLIHQSKMRMGGLLHVGGARVSEKLFENTLENFQYVVEGYGLTECGPGVLLDGLAVNCIVKIQPIEGASKNTGLLWVNSPTMGYWKDSVDEIHQGWYCTQDLAICQGDTLSVVGRSQRRLKSRDGAWILLDELESRLERQLHLCFIHIQLAMSAQLQVTLLNNESSASDKIEIILRKIFDLPVAIIAVDPTMQTSFSKTILAC